MQPEIAVSPAALDARLGFSDVAEKYLEDYCANSRESLKIAVFSAEGDAAAVVCTQTGCRYRASITLTTDTETPICMINEVDHTCTSLSSCASAQPTGPKDYIALSDIVILVISMDKIIATQITEGQTYASTYGEFHHSDMIGKPYGGKLFSRTGTGFIFALRFSPSLWTRSMERRTQIIFVPDISLITMQANLQPGSRVCEAGIGSGSLTHHLLQRIYPGGRLFCCDIDEERARLAKEEILRNFSSVIGADLPSSNLEDMLVASHRDVGSQGFQEEATDIDLVFLDLPCPGTVIPHLKRSLKLGGTCIVFVPCLEQVHAAMQAFCENGFGSLKAIKSFATTYETAVRSLPVPPLRRLKKDNIEKGGQPSRGKVTNARAHVSVDMHDTVKFCGLSPTRVMRTHTGFLVFANYLDTDAQKN